MDEWENPNPIMLSERAAQRSAAQTRAPSSSSHRAKSQCAGGTLAACTVCTWFRSVLWAGSARRDSVRPGVMARNGGLRLTGVF